MINTETYHLMKRLRSSLSETGQVCGIWFVPSVPLFHRTQEAVGCFWQPSLCLPNRLVSDNEEAMELARTVAASCLPGWLSMDARHAASAGLVLGLGDADLPCAGDRESANDCFTLLLLKSAS